MKLTTLVLVAIMTMGLFAGCGKKENTEDESLGSIVIDSQESEDVAVGGNTIPDKTLEDETNASQEETSQPSENVSSGENMFETEDAVEILVDSKPIKLKMTREELDKMVEDYGYTIEDPKYVDSIYTPIGEIRVTITDEELMGVDLIPSLIDLSKVSINGVSLDKVETLKNNANLIEKEDSGYFLIAIADYTTLSADYNSEGELMVISLTREQYSLR